MENRPNLNLENVEKPLSGIESIKERVLTKEREIQNELPENKEKIIKQEISERLRSLQSVSAIPLDDRDEADEIIRLSAQEQVQALVSLVFEKGLERAVSLAKKIDNPALLDEFHDILVNKYYEMLITQGVIKP